MNAIPTTPVKVTYSFTAKGKTPEGNKYNCSGHVVHLDGYPMAAFEAAAEAVFKACGCRPDVGNGGVTLRKLKTKPKA